MEPHSCEDIPNQENEEFSKVDLLQISGDENVHTKVETFEGASSYLSGTDMTIMLNLSISQRNHQLENEFEQKEQQDTLPEPDDIEKSDISTCARKTKDCVNDLSPPALPKGPMNHPRKKLLVLDINGLLADIVSPLPKGYKADKTIARRAIFNRPYYLDFIEFCFEKFEVAIWSSRNKRNVDLIVNHLFGDMKQKLLFCWDATYCTMSKFKTLENKHKPLVFKELRKCWEMDDLNNTCEGNIYNESNTLLVDDSPYKALLNPRHTAIFPHSFRYYDKHDDLLGAGGAIRVYLQNVAAAENVQKYVEQNHFGQSAITESSHNWDFYCSAIKSIER